MIARVIFNLDASLLNFEMPAHMIQEIASIVEEQNIQTHGSFTYYLKEKKDVVWVPMSLDFTTEESRALFLLTFGDFYVKYENFNQ
jgi:hypothetical protein